MSAVSSLYPLPRDVRVLDLDIFTQTQSVVDTYFTSNQHTFAELVEVYWRVKSWAFDAGTFTRIRQFEDEKKLVCTFNWGAYGQDLPTNGSWVSLRIFVPYFFVFKRADKYAPVFQPQASFSSPARLVTKTGRLQYSFLTYLYRVENGGIVVDPYNEDNPSPVDFTVNMAPAEYWPYDHQ